MSITALDARDLIHGTEKVLLYIQETEHKIKLLENEMNHYKDGLVKSASLYNLNSHVTNIMKKENIDPVAVLTFIAELETKLKIGV